MGAEEIIEEVSVAEPLFGAAIACSRRERG